MFRFLFRGLTIASALLFAAGAAVAADHYVAANASASGTGSLSNPWKLQTALNHPGAVNPGDTIWLRGGTYVGAFTSDLNGTSGNPIIVRQYAGERATLDGNNGTSNVTLLIHGSHTWFWGFEVMNSGTVRVSGNTAPPANHGEGINLLGSGTRLINMIVHDTNQGVLCTSSVNGAEIYGSLFYYNGYDGSDRGHGHGAYVANNPGFPTKKVYDNILFQQFGYGIHGYTEGGDLDNIEYQGNTSFNNGGISTHGWSTNILLGGLQVAANAKLISNATYNQDHDSTNNLGYAAGCTSPTVTGNYFESGTALTINDCSSMTITGNTFYGSISGFSQSGYPSNTYYSSRPTGVKVFVRPNAYETGRAHVTIYNWDLSPTVSVDLSSVLSPGSQYVVRNAQNPFGAPVLTGIYAGVPVAFPMTAMSPATPVGLPTPAATGPEFNVFLVTSTLGPFEFLDVPLSDPFHDAIHTLAANGITAGCGNGNFCPDGAITRAQMSVLLLKSKHGALYMPPAATGAVFDDVPATAFAAAWIERLAAEGISSGCGNGDYCPNAAVTRAQMAVFLLKADLGAGFVPPAATGTVFSDVPAGSFAAAWIEELEARGITSGCGAGRFCPGSVNTRGQMAVFLVSTFSLQ